MGSDFFWAGSSANYEVMITLLCIHKRWWWMNFEKALVVLLIDLGGYV